jgi:hypothetical protein
MKRLGVEKSGENRIILLAALKAEDTISVTGCWILFVFSRCE